MNINLYIYIYIYTIIYFNIWKFQCSPYTPGTEQHSTEDHLQRPCAPCRKRPGMVFVCYQRITPLQINKYPFSIIVFCEPNNVLRFCWSNQIQVQFCCLNLWLFPMATHHQQHHQHRARSATATPCGRTCTRWWRRCCAAALRCQRGGWSPLRSVYFFQSPCAVDYPLVIYVKIAIENGDL